MKISLSIPGFLMVISLALMGAGCVQTIEAPQGVSSTSETIVSLGESVGPLEIFACKADVHCVLTTKLYHPCGLVSSIRVDSSKIGIDAHNQEQFKKFGVRESDCDLSPKIENYVASCQEGRCVALKKDHSE